MPAGSRRLPTIHIDQLDAVARAESGIKSVGNDEDEKTVVNDQINTNAQK